MCQDEGGYSASLRSLRPPTAWKGALTTVPVVLMVVSAMLPAVFTGTVTSEQEETSVPAAKAAAAVAMRRKVFRFM